MYNLYPELKEIMRSFFNEDEYEQNKQLYVALLNKRKLRTNNKSKKESINNFINSEILEKFLRTKFNDSLHTDFVMLINDDLFQNKDCFQMSTILNLENKFIQLCKDNKKFVKEELILFMKESDFFKESMKNIITNSFIHLNNTTPNKIDVDYLFMKLKNMGTENFKHSYVSNIVKDFNPLDNVFRIHEITHSNKLISESNDLNMITNDNAFDDDIMCVKDCNKNSINENEETLHDNKRIDRDNDDDFDSISKQNEDTCVIFKYFSETYFRNPTNEEVNDITYILSNRYKIIEIIHSHIDFTSSSCFENLVNSFETIFQRPITIYEFQKYYNESIHWEDRTIECFNKYYITKKELFTNAFAITRNIYSVFIELDVDETFMIRNHWKIFDSNDYEKLLIDHITKQSEYDDIMRKFINVIYKKQFSEEILDYDLEYIFYHVKSKQLHTKSDDLIVVINDLYNETYRFKTLIINVFDTILEREPDKFEIKEYITKFRKDLSNSLDFNESETIDTITQDLYSNIEYNDILKRNIIKIGEQQLLPSQINNIMSKIINWDTEHKLKIDFESLSEFVIKEMNQL